MPAPTIRGTGIQASSNISYAVPWPSGTLAGDLAVILVGHGFNAIAPSGWNSYQNLSGSNWNGAVFSKVLTSTDISTGSVTVGFGGTFDGCLSIITIVGSTVGVKEADASRNGSGSTSIVLTTSGPAISATDLVVYFGSNRAASTDTVSRGTLQQQANDLSSASGCLYTESGASGSITATFNYSVAGIGNYQAIAILGPPPVPTAPNIAAPMTNAGSGPRHQVVKASATVRLTASGLTVVPVASALRGGVIGVAYSETIGVQGGTAPYSFAVTSGALPTGTSLNSSTGVISGTPTVTGAFPFTITVTDANAITGSQSFTINVGATAPPNWGFVA